MHVFCWKVQKANQDAAPKLGVEFGLIINDMHEALNQVELHMKIREVGRNAASQTLQHEHTVLRRRYGKQLPYIY